MGRALSRCLLNGGLIRLIHREFWRFQTQGLLDHVLNPSSYRALDVSEPTMARFSFGKSAWREIVSLQLPARWYTDGACRQGASLFCGPQ